jgi:hypothetical protein
LSRRQVLLAAALFACALAAGLSGCAANQSTAQSASPKVTGYVDVAAEKNIK